ncbi:hypothetical protein CCHL11_08855 [Colletotrichum chlorophyti]|uniref:CFEM domain-containing protein n=1 Tax=Colletotrichum chlorophyti TaxID=708187 RepID=A0A1Q8S0F8_9PEZI|nr:hypothetical protein CCHL11_08855 [Colletotrichum chlorophyti]
MRLSLLAVFATAVGLAAADNVDLPDCSRGCLDDGLKKANCNTDNIKDCYCPKANVNELVSCVTSNCKSQDDLLKTAQAAGKICPQYAFPGTGTGNGN